MQSMCDQIGVKLEILDLREEYLDEVLFDPKYGYGKTFNPCIDCHGFMFRYTAKLLEKYDASFMISGEVVGQRPMSQNKEAMSNVVRLSQCDELIVRPLSAKVLPITKPEREGWINREKLMDITGRSRAPQLQMVKDIGLENFEPPAGGCLLTEINFSKRIEDFIKSDKMEINDIDTLKYGRHLRLPHGAKLIVGRHQEDNEKLKATKSDKYDKARILDASGPLCLLEKKASDADKQLATKFIITYGRTELNKEYEVTFGTYTLKDTRLEDKSSISQYLI
jgi:tRNA-specific 2-thiouridylase